MDWRLLQAHELGPHTLLDLRVRRDAVRRAISPVTIDLACGCRCTAYGGLNGAE